MVDLRLRTKVSDAELQEKVGKIITPADSNVLLTGPAFVRKPDGKPLVCYLPGAVRGEMEWAYGVLHRIRERTDNRGLASGTKRANAGGNRTRSRLVTSQILGSMDGIPRKPECRLTAFSAKKVQEWEQLFPLLQAMAQRFQQHVPDRYRAQVGYATATNDDWIVPGTPFTTVTVNNTYPTGVHTDKGDLDEGFSCLAVARRGEYSGGLLTFPEYRVAVDLRDGDLVLMDAHEWHGNTPIFCKCDVEPRNGACGACMAERISVVAYYRTKMAECASLPAEQRKAQLRTDAKLAGV